MEARRLHAAFDVENVSRFVTPSPTDRPHWTNVEIHLDRGTPALEGEMRLGALFLWLREEANSRVVVMDMTGLTIHDPLGVNWDRFPLQEAIDAARSVVHLLCDRTPTLL